MCAAVLKSRKRASFNGKTPGTISMYVWERSGGIHRYGGRPGKTGTYRNHGTAAGGHFVHCAVTACANTCIGHIYISGSIHSHALHAGKA